MQLSREIDLKMAAAPKSKTLVRRLAKTKKAKYTPNYCEQTIELLHPWCSPPICSDILFNDAKNDAELVEVLADLPIQWQRFDLYREKQQLVRDRLGKRLLSQVPLSDVLREVLQAYADDRTFIFGLSRQACRGAYLAALNRYWKRMLQERKENDPLNPSVRVNFKVWAAKKTWTYNQLVALLLSIDPDKLNFNELDAAGPYSLVAGRYVSLTEKLSDALEYEHVDFPANPTRLVQWANDNAITIPAGLRSLISQRKQSTLTPSSESAIAKLLTEIRAFGDHHSLRYYKPALQDLVIDCVVGGSISDKRFREKIWKKLPAGLRTGGGRPTAAWMAKWEPLRETLIATLNKAVPAKTPHPNR
ncbi:hypothetical protein AB7813_12780 [Tardiphaga sp. 20_F10_N6_6]|uniref:hypothetical protein n=1 Tax=Tardiphaga sp. 20_F10_N6_6 TaxID=3240788 RepID=UPI003F8C21EC